MIKITFTIAFFVLNFTIVFSQQKAELFSVEIKKHYKKFVNSSNIAYENGDVEKGQKLYDSLVKNYLVGTKIEDYTFKMYCPEIGLHFLVLNNRVKIVIFNLEL
jgi:hypothetical protein